MDPAVIEFQAVRAALNGKWPEAIKINQEILADDPENIAALNRLAKAYWESGFINKSKSTYQKVLKINPYNPVASKNFKRVCTQQKNKKRKTSFATKNSAGLFLEEPGKTKVVKLIRLASPKILAEINNADPVILEPRKRLVSISSSDGVYLGSLPEDLSKRLYTLIKGGNRYLAYVKAVDRQQLEIFIKEIFRAKRFKNIPSFVSTGSSYLALNFDQ